MADSSEPLLQDCVTCGTLIDVTDAEPFARMHCPNCGTATRVMRRFAHFEIQEALGSGGMGTVYRALDHNLHRTVALKLLRKEFSDSEEFIQQFEHEAAITALITHPNVVKVYSTGSDHGVLFIAMELVDAGSLDDLMENDGPVPETKVLDVGIQIAHGLNAALRRGLIHRDVKPGNILFADALHAKIVDFGLAVLMEQAGTVGGEIWGTPYYVAPEKLTGGTEDFRSDMYSLAASLFHAVSGTPPCDSEESSIGSLATAKQTPQLLESVLPSISSETAYVLNRMLRADPAERYQTYEDFIEHLEYARTELARREHAQRSSANKAVTQEKEARRTMSWVAVGVCAALAVGGIVAYAFRDHIFGRREPASPSTASATPIARSARGVFDEAQRLFLEGNFGEAAKKFREVENFDRVTRPMQDWATLHEGLSSLLADQPEAAAAAFRRESERPPFSHEPGQNKLAQFFRDASAQLAGGSAAPSPSVLEEAAASEDFRALLPLLWGAKSWSAGDLPHAGVHFRSFRSTDPREAYTWIQRYKPIAERLASQAEIYTEFLELRRAATTSEGLAEVAQKIKSAPLTARLQGKAGEKLNELLKETEAAATALQQAKARELAEAERTDAQGLQSVRSQADRLSAEFRFLEARAALALFQPKTAKGRQNRETLLKRADWLSHFKLSLIRDLIRLGYPRPITNRSGKMLGAAIAPGPNAASDRSLNPKSEYGTAAVAWSEVPFDLIYQIGLTFLQPSLPKAELADRQWRLGVFALMAGKQREGQALLQQAARLKPTYLQEIPLVLESYGITTSSALQPTPVRAVQAGTIGA